jgi:hypothetical protein
MSLWPTTADPVKQPTQSKLECRDLCPITIGSEIMLGFLAQLHYDAT